MQLRIALSDMHPIPGQSANPKNLRMINEHAGQGFDLLEMEGEYQNSIQFLSILMNHPDIQHQRKLTMLAQASANTGNPLNSNYIRHQHIEHNFDSSHELLDELEDDLKGLKEIREKMRIVAKGLKTLREAVISGDYDEGCLHSPTEQWPVVLPYEVSSSISAGLNE